MIHAKFFRQEDRLVGFEFSGHADYAEAGYDIICSAVSSLSQTAMLGITQVACVPADWSVKDSGKLFCRVKDDITRQQREQVSLLTETLKLGIESISEAYPGYLKISIKEV